MGPGERTALSTTMVDRLRRVLPSFVGLLLCEEAGAFVTDERGEPWQVFGPIYIVAATPELSGELQRLAREAVAALRTG